MNLILINIIESSITMAMFFLIYKMFLSKETFFRLNRLYLLSSLLFSVTIPFISLNFNLFPDWGIGSAANSENGLSGIRNGYHELNAVIIYAYSSRFSWDMLRHYLTIIYFIGVITSSVLFFTGFVRMLFIIFRSKTVHYGKYSIIENKDIFASFSLFKWIIINPEKHSSKDMEQIIVHERMHAFQLHSIDLIIIEVLVVLFWFNPFIYWYRKSIREVHEYLADEAVVENGFDALDYQKLLLSQAVDQRFIGLTSSFSYSLSKNRLKMLTMMKSKNISKLKIAIVIPIIIGAIIFFACNDESELKNGTIDEVAVMALSENKLESVNNESVEGEIYFDADVMAKFNNKEADEFRKYIALNLKYPKEAVKKGINGRVYVSFIVDKAGDVKQVKVVRGVDEALDNEAIRVVRNSPKWEPALVDDKPVNVQFTFPIVFALKDKE